jgi:tetratricopeptide (TPR) repeat protein
MNLLKLGPALSYLPLGKSLVLGTLAITAATSSVALQQGSAIAQVISSSAVTRDIDRNEIDKSRNVTVKILGATEGSGVLIAHDDETHTVLTAWHVISSNNKNEEITIKTFDNRKHTTNIEEAIRIGNLDLAIIRFKSNVQYKAVNYPGKDLTPSDMLYVMGYPNTTGTYRKTVGTLVASADVGINQGYQLLYTNNTRSGMSGGPIFDSDYNLIGIHGRGEYNNLKNNKSLQKTNINQGIPIYYYDQHKNGRPIKAKSKDPMTWSDYKALYTSAEKQSRISTDREVNYKPTQLRFLEMMIRLKPKRNINYILRADILTNGNYTSETPDMKKSLELISEYMNIKSEISKLIGSGDKELVLKKLNSLDDYLVDIGSENHYIKSFVYLKRNENRKALISATHALEMELEAYNNGFSKTLSNFPSEITIIGAYHSKGEAYLRMGRFEDAVYALRNSLLWKDRASLMKIDKRLFPNDLNFKLGLAYYELLKSKASRPGRVANSHRLKKDNSLITLADVCSNWIKAMRTTTYKDLPVYCNTNSIATTNNGSVEQKDIKSDKQDANALLIAIKNSYNIDTPQASIQKLNDLIKRDPTFALSYYEKGGNFLSIKEFKKCIIEMNKAIEIQPRLHDAYFARAVCKKEIGDNTGALDDYAHAQNIKPSLDIYYNVSILYDNMSTNDDNSKFHRNKALKSILKGIEFVESHTDYTIFPLYPDSLLQAGLIYGKLGNMKKACLYIKKAVARQDKDSIELIGKLRKEGACL